MFANGFSQSTCLPSCRAAIAISAWLSPGVQMSIRSAQTRRRVVLGDLLDDAYRQALLTEQRPELAPALASWTSVHDVIGNASRAVPAGELKGELR